MDQTPAFECIDLFDRLWLFHRIEPQGVAQEVAVRTFGVRLEPARRNSAGERRRRERCCNCVVADHRSVVRREATAPSRGSRLDRPSEAWAQACQCRDAGRILAATQVRVHQAAVVLRLRERCSGRRRSETAAEDSPHVTAALQLVDLYPLPLERLDNCAEEVRRRVLTRPPGVRARVRDHQPFGRRLQAEPERERLVVGFCAQRQRRAGRRVERASLMLE